jgi:outer membrane lipoprotein-sorting protein
MSVKQKFGWHGQVCSLARGLLPRVPAPILAYILLCLTMTGCHHEEPESIQHFPLTDTPSTLRALADRAHLVHTLSGEGLITLTRPDGQSIRLDAALVMRPPHDARVRAWKFGRAIFDLTITADGVWAITPDDPDRKEQIHAAGINAAKLAKTWSVLSGEFFDEPDLTAQTQGPTLILRRQTKGQPTVLCEVDRPTLTPRKYLMLDDAGRQRFSLTLDHYKQFDQIAWPTRLTAVSEGGTVEVDLHDVQINPDLPNTAFIPPRRAEKLP